MYGLLPAQQRSMDPAAHAARRRAVRTRFKTDHAAARASALALARAIPARGATPHRARHMEGGRSSPPLSRAYARSVRRSLSSAAESAHGGLTKVTLRSRLHATVCRARRHAIHAHRPHASVTTCSFHWCGSARIGVAHAARNAHRLGRACGARRTCMLLAAAGG